MRSRTTAPARTSPAAEGTKEMLEGSRGSPAGTAGDSFYSDNTAQTVIAAGEALAEALRPLFAESRGTGAVEYYVTERSAAFDEIVRVMDPSLDPAAIRVENAFIQ